MNRFVALYAAACLAALGAAQTASAELIYGIANQGNATSLVSWDSATPGTLQSGAFVTNLQANETLVGIDFRPATGQLYGLGSSSRLYTINPASGAATAVGAQFSTLLNGFSFGFDFNPQIDRIRVVSEVNQNLVLNPITGAIQLVATNLFYNSGDTNFGVDPNVVDSAYDRNVAGTPATQLYGIDTALDVLVRQANNTGVLTTVGALGVNVAAAGGFDISGASGVAYAALLPAGASQSSLYTINLGTGTATPVGVIDGGLVITAVTVAPVPEPTTLAGALAALACIAGFRRRLT